MAVNKIIYNGKTYTGDLNLMAGNLFLENSLSNDELTVDTLTATIDGSSEVGTLYVPKGSSGYLTVDKKLFYVLPYIRILVDDLSQYVYGESVLYYRDDTLIGKFYMSSSKRVSKYSFEINCVSAIGLLDNTKHYGGIYTGTPMKDLLADIIGGIIPYTLDPIFLNLPVFGWLPVATRRENLHQLLFAEGATIKKDANGDIVFTYLKSGAATEIADDRMFIGGNIDYGTPIDTVKVLEHSYIAYENQEVTSLYEDYVPEQTITTPNGNTVSGILVLFDNPMFSLSIEGGSILEQGANYAVLKSGNFCKLFGKAYSHTTRENIETKSKARNLVSIVDNTASIENATLVSLANGGNVAKRILAYYGYSKTVSVDIVVENERPGDVIRFNDPFGEKQTGFMQSMNANMSNLFRANSKMVYGFIPTSPGNLYNNSILLTGTGIWKVPNGVNKIRVVIIGAGQGGESGEVGKNGEIGETQYYTGANGRTYRTIFYGAGGSGGNSGAGGNPGKILETDMNVLTGQNISYICGIGGKGGVWNDEKGAGSFGSDTTFLEKSSASGSVYSHGFIDLFSGRVYAAKGENGIAGGSGSGVLPDDKLNRGKGSIVISDDGKTYLPGNDAAEKRATNTEGLVSYLLAFSSGGSGGGAAVGSTGGIGSAGIASAYKAYFDGNKEEGLVVDAGGGAGGKGAKPKAQSKVATYGSGGYGGHGGGGGGGPGAAEIVLSKKSAPVKENVYSSKTNNGGAGGDGGTGGYGCIIVYY